MPTTSSAATLPAPTPAPPSSSLTIRCANAAGPRPTPDIAARIAELRAASPDVR
ncbi:hypothetical protein ABTX81_30535 [Kitasatospora sp. NPDC097605]|uniref:hypothetical protein n=1 Tax=Kitasatospora sp. NPDC097605 TaxID=3157226 RepID=UPI00331D836B